MQLLMEGLWTKNDAEFIKSHIKAPVVGAQYSTLGGEQRASILIVVSLDPKSKWQNGILENSRYARFHVESDGALTLFSGGGGFPKFRKTRVKNAQDVVNKINTLISQVK